MKRLLLVLLFSFLLVGCVGGNPPGSKVEDGEEIGEVSISLGEIAVIESRTGYGNVPGYGTYFEHDYNFELEIVNEGKAVEYEVRVYGKPSNTINPPWYYIDRYGPVSVGKETIQTIDFRKFTGEQGYWNWKIELHVIGSEPEMVDSKTVPSS